MADLEAEPDARARRGRVDADAERGEERVIRRVQDLLRRARTDGPFDQIGVVPRTRPAGLVGGQGGLDDLLLHLAVERDVDLLAEVVLADVD